MTQNIKLANAVINKYVQRDENRHIVLPIDVHNIAEQLGITISERPAKDTLLEHIDKARTKKYSGVFTFTHKQGLMIVLKKTLSKDKKRFIIAYFIGKLIEFFQQKGKPKEDAVIATMDDLPLYNGVFAENLLMPRRLLKKAHKDIETSRKQDTSHAISKMFAVPQSTAWYALRRLKLIW